VRLLEKLKAASFEPCELLALEYRRCICYKSVGRVTAMLGVFELRWWGAWRLISSIMKATAVAKKKHTQKRARSVSAGEHARTAAGDQKHFVAIRLAPSVSRCGLGGFVRDDS